MSVELQNRPGVEDQTPHQLQIDVTTHAEGQRRGFIYKAGVVALSGIALVGALKYAGDHLPGFPDFLPDISNPFNDLGNHPPDVFASVRADTVEVEDIFKVKCEGRLGAAVEVNGNKDELFGSGEYSKLLYGDLLPCGNEIPVKVVLAKDTTNGNITGVKATTNGLVVTQPRVDNTDFRNCVPLRPGDSKKEIDKKIKQWEKDERANKEKCDNGFDIGGFFVVGGDASKVINTGHTGAQIALASYIPGKEIAGMNREFRADLKEELENRYPNAAITVSMNGLEQRTQAQARQVLGVLKDNTYKVEFVKEDGKRVLRVGAPGDGEVTVKVEKVFADAVKIISIRGEVGEKAYK